MNLKIIFLSIFIAFYFINIGFSQPVNFGKITYTKAINIAGRQRMLSQRVSKAYISQVAGYQEFSAKKELQSGIRIFEEQLMLLAKNTKDPRLLDALTNVSDYWSDYQKLLNTTPNKATAILLLNKNSYLLELCDRFVQLIEEQYQDIAHTKEKDYYLIRTVNYSGKQRMLSQRLCLYFLGAKMYSKQRNDYKLVLRKTFNAFDSTITQLMTSPFNDPEVRKCLSQILFYWEPLKTKERELYLGNLELDSIFKTTNYLTDSFDTITALYQEQTTSN